MVKRSILFILCLYIFGCASPKAIPRKYEIPEQDLFVPINLNISAGEYVTHHTAQVVNYLADSIRQSGQFSRIESSFLRWPYTVEIRYSWEQPMGAGDFAGTIVSASTLLIVPGYMDEMHRIEVTLFYRNVVVKSAHYQTEIQTALSLWHNPIEDRKSAINILLTQMFDDFRENALLPTLKEIEPRNDEIKRSI